MTIGELIPRPKVGLGIDIRGGLLCHALLSKAIGRVRLLGWGIEQLPAGEEARDAALKEKLQDLKAQLPKRPAFVTVGLPRNLVTMRSVSMPAVGEAELRGIMEYEVERHMPFTFEEAHYDFQVLEKDAEKATVLLAAARREQIGRYLSLLEEAGIQPTALGVSALASFNALMYNQGRSPLPLSVLVDMRDGEAELVLGKERVLRYCRSLSLSQAAPLDALVPELSGLLAHLEAGREAPKGRIFVSGPGAGKGDMLRHLADRTGLEVEFFHPFRRIATREVGAEMAPSLAAAVGLALNGLVALPLGIDLLPKELAPPRRDPYLAVTFRLLALIAMLGLAYSVGGAIRERRALADVTARVNQLRAEAAKVEQLKEEVAKLGGQNAALEKISRGEIHKLDVMRELVQILPKGVTLITFSVEGREVRIGGSITGSASELISILEQSPVFENVQFTSPVATRGGEIQDFQIKALLESRKEPRT